MIRLFAVVGVLLSSLIMTSVAHAEPREIGAVGYSWRLLGSNDQIRVLALDDPKIEGVVCFWSNVKLGGVTGAMGMATDPSDASLACRQVGPIRFKEKFTAQENVAKESRNWISIKTMQVVRMCDPKTNSLVYLVYSDKIIDGSPKNSISAVPMQPWGDSSAPRCSDGLKK